MAWIASATQWGPPISSAIPPVFDAYATILLPVDNESRDDHDQRILRVLTAASLEQAWWLGYLDTGADEVVFADAPRVRLYGDWPYVLVKAGPDPARQWRAGVAFTMHSRLPDLMFPVDRSWLLSALWDDEWWSVGGCTTLIDAPDGEPGLDVRLLTVDAESTPPGHIAG